MAEIIPSTYRGISSSERKVFLWLGECKISGLVIHSIRYESPNLHETDFLVITKKGILVLEAKGGYVTWSRQEGWMTTDRNGIRTRLTNPPYEQAYKNMVALTDKLKKDLPGYDHENILRAYGVILPDTNGLPATVEAINEITFTGLDEPSELHLFINHCFEYAMSKMKSDKLSVGIPLISDSLMMKLKEYLCGREGILRDLKNDIESTEERIIIATKQQCKILNQLEEGDRLLVRGGAGTGKTLLALEHAIRLSNKGLRVLFLTYNKLLKQFLAKEAKREGIDFINFDKLIFEILMEDADFVEEQENWGKMSAEESQATWNENRPNAFIKRGGLSGSRRYDAVIVDEAQDVLNLRRRLDCIDLMVKGGISKGKVYFFYDEAQYLFRNEDKDELSETMNLLKDKYGYFRTKLTSNCRNTAQIAEFSRLATGFGDPPDEEAIRNDASVEVMFYADDDEKIGHIVNILTDLKGKGIKGGDILILSHRGSKNPNSSLAYIDRYRDIFPVIELDPDDEYVNREDTVKMSNIYRYKGLQEKVVIVADVESLQSENGRTQKENYACFTRAKAKLYVVAHAELKTSIEEILGQANNSQF